MKCSICGAIVPSGVKRCIYCGSPLSASQGQPSSLSSAKESKENLENQSADIYEKNINGCLFISTGKSLGSGFMINESGYGVTNHHVVKGAQELKVTVAGETVSAKVVSVADSVNYGGAGEDLAIIKLNVVPARAVALSLGDSDRVKIGEQVCVIGNSEGKGLCVTRGIVSDKRVDEHKRSRFMTDAAANPGNSGGPYLNSEGKVIAVHVSGDGIWSKELDMKVKFQGMNYGIPINHAKMLLRKNGIKFSE